MGHCERCNIDLPDGASSCAQCGGELAAERDELIGREVLGRYRIVRMLAEGGMGRVYLAEQSVGTVVRRVAIKVLRRQLGGDRQLVSRFSREAETLVRLTHPNTVQLFDFGALPDGTLGLVMEYVEGHSLARELLKGPLSPSRAERLLTQACGALQEAHAHGIVHRDLKPDNMLIAERVGHGDFLKVLDFGIAKVSTEHEAVGTKLTQQGMIIGTPPYMSPEQFSGEAIDARSDVYSLGIIAYEMLTARLPFSAKTPWEWASRHLTTAPEALPLEANTGLLPRHALAIGAALAKRPEDRPQTVADFLSRFVSEAASSEAPLPKAELQLPAGSSSTLTATISAQLRRPSSKLALLAGALSISLVAGLVVLRSPAREARLPPQLAQTKGSVGAEPSADALPDSASTPLPVGASLPSERASSAQAAHPRGHHREPRSSDLPTALHGRHQANKDSELVQPRGEPAAFVNAPLDHASTAQAQKAPARDDAVPMRDVSPAPRTERSSQAGSAGAQAANARRPANVPDDLAQRIGQIQSSSASRVEMAIGLYQAAAGRYGSHPALAGVRAQLASAGEKRIQELIAAGRCAQAQALFRALRAIVAASRAAASFGARCPSPA
ncbi:MAG: Serine/threonine protein kinase PrkC, regulator of stationary phase [Myxococcaceae bacterium]|nr:Serine/threonine protein kinase PrkC, regulator of stationary phase [Myxococcaceae bacterium]